MNILIVRRYLAAWIVLLLSLGLALLVSWLLWEQNRWAGERQFELQVQGIVDDIQARMRRQQNILLGGAGLIDANDKMVSRSQWRTYVERLNLKENYSGIQGVGLSLLIQPKDLPTHIASVRAEGFPEFTVRPPGERPLYTSIVYLEPFSGRNLAAFGYDMFSEPTRKTAITRATETGATTITGKVKLVQENKGKVQAGFLMYVPVYRKNMALDTSEARWRAILGFVYSPYRINDLMQGILGDVHTALDFTINDGTEIDADTLMYISAEDHHPDPPATPRFVARQRIDFYGHTWTASFHSRPSFDAQFDNTLAWVVLALGSGLGVVLFALTASLTGRREKALALAESMTSQIRESEQRFRHILETSPTAARIALSHGHKVVFSNRRYAALLNVRRDQVDGLDPSLYYADRSVYEDVLAHLDRGQPVLDRLVELNIPGAGTKWTLASYFHIAYEGQNAVLGWFHDITDRKRAEIALNEQVQRTQAILDNAVDGIITIDEKGIVSSVNKSAERIFGYVAGEVIGQNIHMLMPEPYHSAHDGYLRNYVTTGKAKIIGSGREVVGLRKNGETFPMDLSVSEISHQGQRMFVGLVRDITERKRAEKMKSEFVSTVSHELRTPLTSISGSLALATSGTLGELPEQAKTMLDIALKNSKHLANLINDLLDMEKIAAGKLSFELKAQPLQPLLEQAIEANKAYGEQYGVTYALAGPAGDIQVLIDTQRLIQVLSNFLSNAAKFSPKGDSVEVAANRADGRVRISVTDHGPGIPNEFRDRIFQKFTQADASDTRQKGGTGLGLAISKELIERMGGEIGFESEEGKGATFYFELPIHV